MLRAGSEAISPPNRSSNDALSLRRLMLIEAVSLLWNLVMELIPMPSNILREAFSLFWSIVKDGRCW